MSGIDWSKAPPWADCVIKSNDCGDGLYWAEPWGTSNGKRCRLGYEDEKVESWHIADTTTKGHAWILIESRPAKAWSGDGLPPVGTACECMLVGGGDEWVPCEIIAHKDNQAVCWVDCNRITASTGTRIRPIHTLEQIAAEEREIAIDALKKVFDSCSDDLCPTSNQYLETLFGAIHDAGWIKKS